jgi:hypothetical protein
MAKPPEQLVARVAQDRRGRRGAKLPHTRLTLYSSSCQVTDVVRWEAFSQATGPILYITGMGDRAAAGSVHRANARPSPVRSTSTARSSHRLPDSQLVSDANRHA